MPHSLAICFTNFGPYHIARLEALGHALAQQGGQLFAYEMAGSEEKYPWATNAGLAGPVQHVRLFPGRTLESLTARECRAAVQSRLDQDQPTAIAAVGYVRPESLQMLRWATANKALRLLLSESQKIDHPRVWWKEAVKARRVRRFQAGVVGGDSHRNYLAELGLPRDRIHLGYNAVGNRQLEELLKSDPSSQNLPAAPFFLTVCRFAPEKNLHTLLQAYAAYAHSVKNAAPWRLVLAGDGQLRQSLQEQAFELGIASLCDWPGFLSLSQLVPLYQACGAFVLPSLSEPWGLVVNEAAYCGAPLLISDRCGCVATFVPKSGLPSGRIFDPTRPDELACQMSSIAGLSPAARRLMGDSARSIACQWGPDRFAQGVLAALDSAVKTTRPRTARAV